MTEKQFFQTSRAIGTDIELLFRQYRNFVAGGLFSCIFAAKYYE